MSNEEMQAELEQLRKQVAELSAARKQQQAQPPPEEEVMPEDTETADVEHAVKG